MRRSRSAAEARRAVGVAAVVVCAWLCCSTTPALGSVEASTAIITVPGGSAPLRTGNSSTLYGVELPAGATCPGDTAHKGYHVFSYLVRKGTSPASIRFTNIPDEGLGYFSYGAYFGAANTAEYTGQIVDLPAAFSWSRLTVPELFRSGTVTSSWEGGIACADDHGVVSNYWNTQIVFHVYGASAHDFSWSVVDPVPHSRSPIGWIAGALLVIAAVCALSALSILLKRRDERRKHVRA